MDSTRWLRLAFLVLVGAFALAPVPARAETQVCTVVSSLPVSIDTAGTYCLEQNFDLTTISTAAVQIDADQVVFDCNHHAIVQAGHPGEYTGIYVPNERQAVTIRNCTVDAFSVGIFVQSSSEVGARANLVEGNTVLHSGQVGIYTLGSNNHIERNRVSGNTGASSATGIQVLGFGYDGVSNTIRDNIVSDFRPPLPNGTNATTLGITFSNVNNTEVSGNTVTGLYAPTGREVHAIESQGTHGSVIERNVVLSPPPLPAPLDGLQAFGIVIFGGATDNVCRDNVAGHYEYANLSGCTDSVNTDF
jgi:parallel beta-helix repeat protein